MNKNEQSINPYEKNMIHKNKDIRFDLLRLLLAFMVVVLHISAGVLLQSEIPGLTFAISVYFNCAVRASVPLFIMISGYFNLTKEAPLEKTFKKSLSLLTIFLAWSCFYALGHMINSHYLLGTQITIRAFIEFLSAGQYHLWFLPTLIHCYLMSPLFSALKKYEEGKYIKYFILLFFIFGILKYSISQFLSITQHHTLNSLLNRFGIISLTNFIYYYLLGYYISKMDLKMKSKYLILLFAIITALNAQMSIYFSNLSDHFQDAFIGNFYIITFFQAILLFKIFQNIEISEILLRHSEKFAKASNLTLGVYLIHPVFVDMLKYPAFDNMRSNPLFIVFSSMLIFFISASISLILKKLPMIQKII